jgi:hypothetical protein
MGKPVKREPEPKKPYAKPQLTVYGTVQQLTERVGTHGTTDGGGRRRPRTHV